MLKRLDPAELWRLLVLMTLAGAPSGTDAAPPSASVTPTPVCVVSGVHEERGTFLGNPSSAWKVVNRFRVGIDADGTCVSDAHESSGPHRAVTYTNWHREPGVIVGVNRALGTTLTVSVDDQSRPVSELETYQDKDSTVHYIHRWRVERDSSGRVVRLHSGDTVDESAAWPDWDDLDYAYTRVESQTDRRTYVDHGPAFGSPQRR